MSMKKMAALILIPGLVTMMTTASTAGGVGTTGAQFLKIGTGARPVAMGYAFSAVADDLNALYWNPAGLALQMDRQMTANSSPP